MALLAYPPLLLQQASWRVSDGSGANSAGWLFRSLPRLCLVPRGVRSSVALIHSVTAFHFKFTSQFHLLPPPQPPLIFILFDFIYLFLFILDGYRKLSDSNVLIYCGKKTIKQQQNKKKYKRAKSKRVENESFAAPTIGAQTAIQLAWVLTSTGPFTTCISRFLL
jgi:hypothetical protein